MWVMDIYRVHLTLTRTVTTLNIFVCISAGVRRIRRQTWVVPRDPSVLVAAVLEKDCGSSVTYPHLVLAKAQIDVRRETDLVYGIGIRWAELKHLHNFLEAVGSCATEATMARWVGCANHHGFQLCSFRSAVSTGEHAGSKDQWQSRLAGLFQQKAGARPSRGGVGSFSVPCNPGNPWGTYRMQLLACQRACPAWRHFFTCKQPRALWAAIRPTSLLAISLIVWYPI